MKTTVNRLRLNYKLITYESTVIAAFDILNQ